MTTFKEIRGTTIEVVSSDPSNPELGQIWYNSSSGTLKGYKNINVWSSGGNYPDSIEGGASVGTQTAALGFGGGNPTIFVLTAAKYDGSTWTATGSMVSTFPNGRGYLGGAGTQTAALAFGGYAQPPGAAINTAATESFNGSTWTVVNSMNTARRALGNAGIQTAALAFGGYGPVFSTATESWNGTSWTTLPATLPTGVAGNAGVGIQTAALSFGGDLGPTTTATTNSFNGTSWTAVNSLNTTRAYLGGFGLQTSAIAAGGGPPTGGTTEIWNGTSWTSNPTGMSTGRQYFGANGNSTAGLAVAGNNGSTKINTVEEFTGLGTQTITVS
jgi:hypothetical protein